MDPQLRLRRSRALVLEYEAASAPATEEPAPASSTVMSRDSLPRVAALWARSFLSGGIARVDSLGFAILEATTDWITPEHLFGQLVPPNDRARVARTMMALVDAGLLVVESTEAAERDASYESNWRWGSLAGLFHFGIKNARFERPETVREHVAERVASEPRVPLWREHDDGVSLPSPRFEGALGVMRSRRSSRAFDPVASIAIEALSDVLVAGAGITGFFETAVPGEGPLPLGMTPSGGARNPFEAYVLAARVAPLSPGVYHYSGVGHSLARVESASALPSFASLLGGQEWFEHAAALILLVAEFPRTMWKYQHPNGYRVVLIEAGHIAQNMLLAATSHRLAAAPTCALSDRAVESALGLDGIRESAVYAIGLGMRSDVPSIADVCGVVPNPRFG